MIIVDIYHQLLTKNNYLPVGYGSIYNHSDTANLGWKIVSEEYNIMHFISNKDIEIGEELTHNYGEYYWKVREKKLL